ncbi:MAG: hypothetical protein Q9M36_12300 [Sulfurovum sp.]|nr:hypothetical protein [Sulfurovum sp.]
MSHFKNKLYQYFIFIIKFRIVIIGFFTILFLYLALTMTTMLTHNDEALWLQGSTEHTKLLENNHQAVYIEKLQLHLGEKAFSSKNIDKMKLLHSNLNTIKDVIKINSPLTHTVISFSDDKVGSSLVEAHTLQDSTLAEISNTLTSGFKDFTQFYSTDKETLYIYVFSSSPVDFSSIYIPFKYDSIKVTQDQNIFKDMTLFSILLSTLFILFCITFRTLIPSLLGVVFIVFTTLFTISVYKFIQPDVPLHVSILLVSIAVSIMDFIYIYNGWHTAQASHSSHRSLYYIMMKTIKPIFWTSVVTVVGIGALTVEQSIILQSIGYNIVLSSLIAFILTFTLLIAMLSFFKIKKPYIMTKNSSRFVAGLEARYKKSLLQVFLIVTGLISIATVSFVLMQPSSIIEDSNDEVIHIMLPSDGLTHASLLKLENFHDDITSQFEDDIVDIVSSYKYARGFTKAYNPSMEFEVSKINLSFIAFDFILYNIQDDLMLNSNQLVTIYIEEDGIDKNVILQWIREWNQDKTTLIDDAKSLLSAAKYDSISHMIYVVFFILFLLTFIIFHITKNKMFAFIALTVNAIPLVWFIAILLLLDISLSIEILVSMLIMIALSSDASIHFLCYFHRNSKDKLSNEEIIEHSFIEVGTPIGMGSTILLLTFLLLIFANIPTISTIGVYAVILIILSLLADLFILPVLFIELIKSKSKVL